MRIEIEEIQCTALEEAVLRRYTMLRRRDRALQALLRADNDLRNAQADLELETERATGKFSL